MDTCCHGNATLVPLVIAKLTLSIVTMAMHMETTLTIDVTADTANPGSPMPQNMDTEKYLEKIDHHGTLSLPVWVRHEFELFLEFKKTGSET